jgi:hypothetical protein
MLAIAACHHGLHASVIALDCFKQATDSAVLIWQLMRHMFGSSLHGDAGVTVLSNELFKIEVTLTFPLSRVQQLLMPFCLSFPFVITSTLV